MDSQNLQPSSVDQNSFSTQDVLDICSAPFQNSSKSISSPEISTQQLKEVFTGSMNSATDFNTQDVNDICSGGFTGMFLIYFQFFFVFPPFVIEIWIASSFNSQNLRIIRTWMNYGSIKNEKYRYTIFSSYENKIKNRVYKMMNFKNRAIPTWSKKKDL